MEQKNCDYSKGYQVQADSIGQVGDRYESYGPLEIIVAGVGEAPPNFKSSWVERAVVQAELQKRIAQNPVTEIVAGGGFGKSWLAAWAFDTLANTFDKRLWVNFRRELWQSYGFDRFARWVLQEIFVAITRSKPLLWLSATEQAPFTWSKPNNLQAARPCPVVPRLQTWLAGQSNGASTLQD